MVKIQGILTLVFGGIGVLFGLFLMGVLALAINGAYTDADALGFFLLFIATVIFWILPHAYFIAAGVTLAKAPTPKIVKTLSIINLVIGAFWNVILLVFAIISLVQSTDYEDGYKHHK